MLKPEELQAVTFTKGFKGYNTNEVDEYISKLISEYTELYKKQIETEKKLQVVADKYKQASSRAAEALSGVKQMSEAIISEAQTQGEEIIENANKKAASVNAAMKESCSEILASYAELFGSEKQKLIALEEKSREFRQSLLEAYKNHIADIQGEFPTLETEEIENMSFETTVAPVFKEKLQGEKKEEQEAAEEPENNSEVE